MIGFLLLLAALFATFAGWCLLDLHLARPVADEDEGERPDLAANIRAYEALGKEALR